MGKCAHTSKLSADAVFAAKNRWKPQRKHSIHWMSRWNVCVCVFSMWWHVCVSVCKCVSPPSSLHGGECQICTLGFEAPHAGMRPLIVHSTYSQSQHKSSLSPHSTPSQGNSDHERHIVNLADAKLYDYYTKSNFFLSPLWKTLDFQMDLELKIRCYNPNFLCATTAIKMLKLTMISELNSQTFILEKGKTYQIKTRSVLLNPNWCRDRWLSEGQKCK